MKIEELPAKVLYNMARLRWMYGRKDLPNYLKAPWFVEPIYRHVTGRKPRWPWGTTIPPEDAKALQNCCDVMERFCHLSDNEVEEMLVSRSTLDAANYSIRYKDARLEPSVEKVFLERCKGKKSRMSALLHYCGKWEIMPDNMSEVILVAGFEGGSRARVGANFIKKLAENKRRCKDLLSQIMKLEGIGEDEPIKNIMARLG